MCRRKVNNRFQNVHNFVCHTFAPVRIYHKYVTYKNKILVKYIMEKPFPWIHTNYKILCLCVYIFFPKNNQINGDISININIILLSLWNFNLQPISCVVFISGIMLCFFKFQGNPRKSTKMLTMTRIITTIKRMIITSSSLLNSSP